MSTTTFEGFSISHAAILDGTTGAELSNGQIYAIREGTIQVQVSNYDNSGDDQILSTWFWFDYATLNITGGFVPFTTIALLTGATITSSGAAPSDYYMLPMWQLGSQNQPTRPVLIRVPSKDSNGVLRTMDIVLYKVQFQPFNFQGPSYKNGLILSYGGRALLSAVDEAGQAVSPKAIGKLVNYGSSATAGYPYS